MGIFDQMQNACKEEPLSLGPADIDDAGVLELVIKQPQDVITGFIVQRVERPHQLLPIVAYATRHA